MEALEFFFSQFKPLLYKKRETVLRADDTPQGVYFIKKGYVRVYSISQEGQELTLFILQPNDFFPVRWSITRDPIRYSYETLTPTEVWRAPRELFVSFLRKRPGILFEIMRRTLTRLGSILQGMEYLVYGDAYAKVAAILLILTDRFGRQTSLAKRIAIPFPLTHKDIAALIGVTRETVSLEMEKLYRKNILVHESHFVVVSDIEKLKKESLL
ncbi:MAG: Crp/Fnr family transcriptional regulator [Candidatus Levybacteria bacterium]|nr:Crp/Fnr family transcriptional regulator [Candidatus Levybacteria bacterium]